MGRIDVADLLSDTDFVSKLTLIHRTSSTDTRGENQIKERAVPTYGSVQPASGETLQRLPEVFRVADVKSFWIKGTIISDGQAKYPDIIFYRGVRYAVQVVFDWSDWGQGWCEGTCVREKPIR